MRIWSLHPRYLDQKGLTAVWRESLLAQKVLCGETRGYRSHPQLLRFRQQPDPLGAIGAYLQAVQAEATRRGYHFQEAKILQPGQVNKIDVPLGQVQYEWEHLKKKLAQRDPARLEKIQAEGDPELHPLFLQVPGGVAEWEKVDGIR
jgi:hypothetical protein